MTIKAQDLHGSRASKCEGFVLKPKYSDGRSTGNGMAFSGVLLAKA